MDRPIVTYVVATYNRPDTLKVALQSLIRQSYKNWRAIVVGDRCDGRTAACIAGIDDTRISYVNLTTRCGEQSGPNSVGMSLVSTPFLGFLNHDDVLLPDHVAYGLERMRQHNADFFIGRAARLERTDAGADGDLQLLFSTITPMSRDVTGTLRGATWDFEPCSTWIVNTKRAHRIGLWRRSTTIHRTPLADWILRAWRARATFTFGERVTAIWVTTHYQRKDATRSGVYAVQSVEHAYIDTLLNTVSCDDIRARIAAGLISAVPVERAQEHGSRSQPGSSKPHMVVAHLLARWLYRHVRIDLYAIQARLGGRDREWDAKALSRLKTGDDNFSDHLDYASLVRQVRQRFQKSSEGSGP